MNSKSCNSKSGLIFSIGALQGVPDMYYTQELVYEASRVLFDWRSTKFEEDTPMGHSNWP